MKTWVERLDHLGLVAGIIKELRLAELIDERIGTDRREEITTGESIAGMIINGLGFCSKPLSLTPHFFKNKAISSLFREGVTAEHFNANKLSRSLDKIHDYGLETLFSELSAKACAMEKIDTDKKSLDTTTVSVTGEYDVESDENTIQITHGYSKDHRPDLKQLVHELLVSQDGGVPLMMKSWDGNKADNEIFRKRAQALVETVKDSEWKGYLIGDAKLYDRKNAAHLKLLKFITRIPGSLKEELESIKEALEQDRWIPIEGTEDKYYTKKLTHYDIEQRWVVVYSKAASERALKRINKLVKNEEEKVLKFQKEMKEGDFSCGADAMDALEQWRKQLVYHEITEVQVKQKAHFSGKGRPKKAAEPERYTFGIEFCFSLKEKERTDAILQDSCYIVGSNADEALSDIEIVKTYKNQNSTIENMGFRFLKDPIFFASSLFLKRPDRIEGLLFVMCLSLLVYSIAQRRLRQKLKVEDEYVPNQINQPTQSPTLRWIFQLLEGIDIVYMKINEKVQKIVTGLGDLSKKILSFFGDTVCSIYKLGVII